jgi:TPR repeat protein
MIDEQQLIKDAEHGDVEAQFKLGAWYYEGDVLDEDLEKGLFWLEKAAAGGNVNAMINCHIHWSYRDEDKHNNHIGRLWGMAAAATGDSNAQ